MDVKFPEEIKDLIVYDVDGTQLFFDNKEDLEAKLQKCKIQPVIKIEGFDMDEENNLQPITVLESINIMEYIV